MPNLDSGNRSQGLLLLFLLPEGLDGGGGGGVWYSLFNVFIKNLAHYSSH